MRDVFDILGPSASCFCLTCLARFFGVEDIDMDCRGGLKGTLRETFTTLFDGVDKSVVPLGEVLGVWMFTLEILVIVTDSS